MLHNGHLQPWLRCPSHGPRCPLPAARCPLLDARCLLVQSSPARRTSPHARSCRRAQRSARRARAPHALPLRPLCRFAHASPLDAQQTILNVIGGQLLERWPEEEERIILYELVLSYSQRITAITFLYGNFRDVDLVYTALQQQIGGDPHDRDHARRLLADLASGRYDDTYFYFNVLAADWLFLNGTLNARHAPPSPHARALHAWDGECARLRRREGRWPTLAEQRAFFG